jgi:hypothetical protein
VCGSGAEACQLTVPILTEELRSCEEKNKG